MSDRTRRPLQGWLSHHTCPECGNRLWTFRFGGDGGLVDTMYVYICGRCDRPAEPGRPMRRITPAGEPIDPVYLEKVDHDGRVGWYERDWFVLLLVIGAIAGLVIGCVTGVFPGGR